MAASGGPVRDLCDEATCSICLECFRDPVIIPECGHNFCRSCLIQCWEKSEGEASCPLCRERVEQSSIRRNQQLANFVEIIKNFYHPQGEEKEKEGSVRKDQESPARAFVQSDTSRVLVRALRILAEKLRLQEEKQEKGKRRVCEKHQEPLKLFCQEDQSPICVVCHVSKEHKSHEVVPLEEASQEYKKQTDAEREKMVAEFRRLHQFLEEQEKRILAQMAEVEKEIAAKREEQLARLSRELSSLEGLIREMEEKLQEPASELLQDIRSFLQRSQEKEKLEDPPVAFPPALKWRIWDFCDINPFLEGVMEKFRDTVEYGLQLQKENITLDPDTAHPRLILSEDRKIVRDGEVRQDLPDNPERFDTHFYVLGCEGFTAGRHFWEVIVGREERWEVGVARKSVKRKGFLSFGPREGIWGLGKWLGGYKVCSPHEDPVPSEEPKRIRVTLNCEGGRVSFYNADTAALLYIFPAAPFSGETLQPLFYVSEKANLRLS
ncbi:E3 ubiquitin-protein ligase TRIM7-like [Podarcis lilfordi]|uniref:E3 ubiquitin-protein ligase TRIM7-like n=1 Tax=Podarcis lilfordi TaxID=74358 RepID=A0AA35JZQ1_9SAUR|nr:E3 ubiquitin-protein ligase TRIM7-like [Podarcis lilfordi]